MLHTETRSRGDFIPEYLRVLKSTVIVFANFRIPLLITEFPEGRKYFLPLHLQCLPHTKALINVV